MSLIHKNIIKFGFSQSIVLQYRDLKDGKDLTGQIETAFGPKGRDQLIDRPWHIVRGRCTWFRLDKKAHTPIVFKASKFACRNSSEIRTTRNFPQSGLVTWCWEILGQIRHIQRKLLFQRLHRHSYSNQTIRQTSLHRRWNEDVRQQSMGWRDPRNVHPP